MLGGNQCLYLDLEEKESVSKNFKDLLKKYNKSDNEYLDGNDIKNIKFKLDLFLLLQNNLKIKNSFIKK